MDRVIRFLIALGTVLTAAGEVFKQYNLNKNSMEQNNSRVLGDTNGNVNSTKNTKNSKIND